MRRSRYARQGTTGDLKRRDNSSRSRVVTNIAHCGPQWLYDSLYWARGQAENLIKRHKSQLASDRTSCAASKPDAADPAHRRLLADAGGA
jgi:Transposase DDE domain group 1